MTKRSANGFPSDDEWGSLVGALKLTSQEAAILSAMFEDERETAIAAALGFRRTPFIPTWTDFTGSSV